MRELSLPVPEDRDKTDDDDPGPQCDFELPQGLAHELE
jgi:hypothetical protein